MSTFMPGWGAPRRQASTMGWSYGTSTLSQPSCRQRLSNVLASASASVMNKGEEDMSAECTRERAFNFVCYQAPAGVRCSAATACTDSCVQKRQHQQRIPFTRFIDGTRASFIVPACNICRNAMAWPRGLGGLHTRGSVLDAARAQSRCIVLCVSKYSSRFRPRTPSRLAPSSAQSVQPQDAGLNHPFHLHSAAMVTFKIVITDADAEASTVLRRSRLDGLDTVPVPFEEQVVQAWRRGAPEPGMDVEMLQKLVEVRGIALQRH